MTDKELVERLRIRANGMLDEWDSILCKRSEFITAANRIEQLRAELYFEKIDNTNLIGELATVAAERDRYKAERDAAVNDLKYANNFYTECFFCKYETDEGSTRCGKKDCWDEAFHYSKHEISDTSKAIALECMIDASNRENPKPSTNADRIRAMDDKAISVLLNAVKFRRECFIKIPDFLSIKDAYKWLQQPAEEER